MSDLSTALVAALAELTNPRKDKTARMGTYSYTYADLATILDLVRPVLGRHGLAVTQDVQVGDGSLSILTTLHHASGQVLTFGPIQARAGGDWQALGSAITYARRYALTAALGITGDEDDDANTIKDQPVHRPVERSTAPLEDDPWSTPPAGAQAVEQARKASGTYRSPSGKHLARGDDPATEKQRHTLDTMVQGLGYEGLAQFLEAESQLMLGATVTPEQLTKAHAEVVFTAIKAYKAEGRP